MVLRCSYKDGNTANENIQLAWRLAGWPVIAGNNTTLWIHLAIFELARFSAKPKIQDGAEYSITKSKKMFHTFTGFCLLSTSYNLIKLKNSIQSGSKNVTFNLNSLFYSPSKMFMLSIILLLTNWIAFHHCFIFFSMSRF